MVLVVAVSCKKFLNEPPQGLVSEDAIKTDPQAAVNLVAGAYNALWLGDAFGTDVHSLNYVIMTEVASDNADKGSSPDDYGPAKDIDNFTLTSTNSIVNNIWKGYYQAIARVNQALDKLPLSPLPDAQKNALIGEVRFLRAYFYFNMVRFFGGVPLIDKVPDASQANSDQYQTRASADSVYNFIISDLTFAVNNLPVKEQSQVGKANKGAAASLLAKVYMYRKNWPQVLSLTNEVIAGTYGSYDLYPTYEDIWRQKGENSVESIFEVQTGVNANCKNAIQLYTVCQGPRSGGKGGWQDLGFGFNTPSQSLADSYEPGDKRKAGTIIFITATGTTLWDGFRIPGQDSVQNTMYSYKAYHSRTAEDNCGVTDYLPKNLRILRFADVLLMNAEAANETGDMGLALSSLNRVRARAGLPAVQGVSQGQLRDTIWHERRVELAMEHDRFFDIVRQGTAAKWLQAQGKNFQAGKNEVFPIPSDQIALSNGRLKQNPNYN
ncbi:RagB/SusD family nutrient uptake outer membrane protein [Deminuibacter soli]|uniref:RagB/SusD family nutrient uptake outer membrane protein n=2 Tax=Deminuibacter soli TaxID=2291815 RepID=A0A3E1NPU9_9BACT|nr:RagB/SusD family nutrient uptake outer membrane protein [Deminuibacter soli]